MIKAIITDIEGTTTSLSFVKDVLFPYARARLADFVWSHENDPQVKPLLDDVRRELSCGSSHDITADIQEVASTDQVIEQLIQWIDQDKKATPLKSLQGMIWEDGYQQGAFHGHVYQDAVDNLKAWKASGLELYIYSSGSVHAQKLLFAHTDYGDLTLLFSGYFDTAIGGKKESGSYRKIAECLGYPADTLMFLSDSKEELDAAKAAGLNTIRITRDAASESQAEHRQVCSFDEISISP